MPKSKKNTRDPVTQPQGISNRETPEEEAEEREAFPPVQTSSPPPQDVSGRVGEQPLDDLRDRHTSHKAGSRSVAQKESESKYADRGHPASHKVEGAFGREPRRRDDEAEDQANDAPAGDRDS
jgi:hypothetical protein